MRRKEEAYEDGRDGRNGKGEAASGNGRGSGSGSGSGREVGSRSSPITLDLDPDLDNESPRTDPGADVTRSLRNDSETQDAAHGRAGVVARMVNGGGGGNRAGSNGVFRDELAARPAHAGRDATPMDPRRAGKARGPVDGEGGSREKPVLVEEGEGSFDLEADARSREGRPGREVGRDHGRDNEFDDLFEEVRVDPRSAVVRGPEGGDRKTGCEKDEEEAALAEVDSVFKNQNARARDTQTSNDDRHKAKIPDKMESDTRSLLEVLTREAQGSVQSPPAARTQDSSRHVSVLSPLEAEVEARKSAAVERARIVRVGNGKLTLRREAEAIRLDAEDDGEQLRLAQACLKADTASRQNAKQEKDRYRLRKEKEANEQASSARMPRGPQRTSVGTQVKTGRKTRSSRDDEGLMAQEARRMAEGKEEERRVQKEQRATRVQQDADRFASVKRKAAMNAARRMELDREKEERRAKAAEAVGRPTVRIKVENSDSDDAARSVLQRELAMREAAAEKSRSRQAQNSAEYRPKLVGERPSKTSESAIASVPLSLIASEEEVSFERGTNPANPITLDDQLHQANEILQAAQAQKRVLELEAKARKVQAECTALKRRAEQADAEEWMDESIRKKARSTEQSVGVDQSRIGSQNTSGVEDMASPHDPETQDQGRRPAKTREERLVRRRASNKRWRLKKEAEKRLLLEQNQQEEMRRSVDRQPSEASSTESEFGTGISSRPEQPMGLRALTSGLISHATGRQREMNGSESEQPTKLQKQDSKGSHTSNAEMKSVVHRRDSKAKSNMMKERAAKDEQIDTLKAQLASFKQPQIERSEDPAQTGTADTYIAQSPVHQESQATVSSDEDEDENQAATTAQSFRLSGPQQTPNPPEEAQAPPPRPTCARKTLPTQTHQPPPEETDSGLGPSPDQEEPPTELVWAYQVTRKEWLSDEDANDVGQMTDGPYWSKEQANSIAATEVHQERGDARILAPMEFNMTIDALGMRTHSICSVGGNIATAVERVLVRPSRADGPMADKKWLPPRIFVALEKVSREKPTDDSGMSSGEEGRRASFVRVLGIFTVLDLANREASRCALAHQSARLGESTLDEIVKAEKVMRAREHLEILDRDCRTFENSCALSDHSGVVETWVEEHAVVGPRN